ncbi:WD40-like repeat protein [Marinitoga piezophila KA3]|uniref:WD40-like repeat protein n=1 Tax=Marinitoga piezophila (strain DSM 14283 / JCM 11233 / KA3) TaxID=443254 RepID=H2J3S5_MARPK|nr:PQQ-binding-like beta-propeller repeat protein [Marinitoga piezophila]AEX85817.1 WD40-like repeat protein [Marinitoga piezophila KA3]
MRRYFFFLILIFSLFLFSSCNLSLPFFTKPDNGPVVNNNIDNSAMVAEDEKNKVEFLAPQIIDLLSIDVDNKLFGSFLSYDNLFYYHDIDTLYIYSLKDKKIIYSERFNSTLFSNFIISHDNNLIFSNGSVLYKYSFKGKKLFEYDFNESIKSIAITPFNEIYVLSDVGTLFKLKDKEVQWSKRLNATITSNLIISYNNRIFFGDANGNIYIYDSNGNRLGVSKISGSAVGNFATDNTGKIYVLSSNKYLYVIDNNGEILWTNEYDEVLLNVLVDDNLNYYLATDENIYVYNKDFEEIGKYEIGKIFTQIIYAKDKILFGTKDKLLNVLDLKEKKVYRYKLSENILLDYIYFDGKNIFIPLKDKVVYTKLDVDYNALFWTQSYGYLNRGYMNLPPQKPMLVYPKNNTSVVVEKALKLIWKSYDLNNEGLTYNVYYGTNKNSLSLAAKNLVKPTFELKNLRGKRTYYVKITAFDSVNAVDSDVYAFRILYKPERPVAVQPLNEEKNISLNPVLKWEARDKDSTRLKYNLYFGEDKDNLSPVATNLTLNTFDLKQKLKPSFKYYWKVEVIDDNNNKNISNVFEFVTSNPPSTPVILEPDLSQEISYDATFVWESKDEDNDNLSYDLYLGYDDGEMKKIIEDYKKNEIVISYLSPGKSYRFKIGVRDGKGNYVESKVYIIKVKFSPILQWKFIMDDKVEGNPALDNEGNIYVGDNSGYFYKINSKGILLWRFKTEDKIWSSPTYYNGLVYFGSNDGYLYVLNSKGELIWKFKTQDIITSSPLIDIDGTIYVGSWDGFLYAINPDGTLKWKFKTNNSISGSPVMGRDGTIYIGSWDGFLYAINPDGTLKWKFKTENRISQTAALDREENIYIGSEDGNLYVLNFEGELKWKFKTESYIKSSPVIDRNGVVYIGGWDNYFYAINPDGSLKWKYKTEYVLLSSPVIGNLGNIYMAGYDHFIYCFDEEGSLKWKREMNDMIGTNLILSNNKLIFADVKGFLYVLNVQDKNLDSLAHWPAFKRDNFNMGKLVTVRNSLPLGPDNPYPEDNQKDVSLYTKLKWQAYDMDGDKIVYDLYFGTEKDKLKKIVENSPVSEYTPEHILSPKTVYYWKVVVKDVRNGVKEGPVWSFKTINPYGKIKWNFKTLGWVENTPLIVGNSIYFGSYDKYFYALTTNGNLKWKFLANSEIIASPNTEDNNIIYFGDVSGRLYSITRDGTLIWTLKLDGDIISTPLVKNGKIYIGTSNGILYAIDKNGEILWTFKTGDYIASMPSYYDGNIIFGSSDSYVYSINEKGELNWKFRTSGAVKSSPSIDNEGNIYIGSDDNYLYKLTKDGILVFKFKTNSSIQTKASIDSNGNIYFGSLDHYLYIINKEGKLITRFKTDGPIISTPTFDDKGYIYFASLDSKVYALNKDYKIDWIFKSGYGISSSPIVKDGILYISSKDGYMYALQIEGENTPENYIIKNYYNK